LDSTTHLGDNGVDCTRLGFAKRSAYAFTRLFVTRTDSGGETFNFFEIVGNGAGAGISDLYYPSQERT
jgi:hypothetical protein